MITERRTINFGTGGKLCFDFNMYLGTYDYEIEVEYSEQDKSSGDALATIIDSDTKVTGETKSNRFFKKWEEIRLKHCNLSTIPKKGAQNQAP